MVSLVAGITLLVTGLASLLERRAEVGDERDQRLEVSAELIAGRLDATVARITAAMAVATADTPLELLADALATPVCVVDDDGPVSCSAASPAVASGATITIAVTAASGQPVPVVVATAGAADRPAGATVASDQGDRTILAAAVLDAGGLPDGTVASLVPVERETLLRPQTVDSMRTYAAPSMVEFDDGPWAVRTTSDDAVRLTTDERWLIGAQALVGAVLAALALGGIVAEQRSLHRRATTDGLTGLPNRAEFARRANAVLLRLAREGGAACLLVVDLDEFKAVNDSVGHEAGDQALVAAAERLRAAVRRSDLVGRWGGDEFVVLLPGVAEVRSLPDRVATIADAIAAAPQIGGRELSASVGAALFPAHGTSLETLLRTADRAMYAAKVRS